MSDVGGEFLFAPPGALKPSQISKLEARGITVVVSKQWDQLRICRSTPTLPTGDLMAAAGSAINCSEYAQKLFGENVAKLMQKKG